MFVATPVPDGVEIREAHEDNRPGRPVRVRGLALGEPEAFRPQRHDILTRFQVGRPDSNTRMWMGYAVVVLDSSPVAEKLYQRLGCVTVTHVRLFADAPATS